jgi:hypothetical protein
MNLKLFISASPWKFSGPYARGGGQDSVVGIPIRYRLDGPVFEPRWGWVFLYPSRLAARPTKPPRQWVSAFFPDGKAALITHAHLPPRLKIQRRTIPLPPSPTGLLRPVMGRSVRFTFMPVVYQDSVPVSENTRMVCFHWSSRLMHYCVNRMQRFVVLNCMVHTTEL